MVHEGDGLAPPYGDHACGALGADRAERVRQVRERDPSVADLAAYVPTEAAVEQLRAWSNQGAEIRLPDSVAELQRVRDDA